MNTALTVISFVIGLGVVVYACYKLGSLMPFSVEMMRARKERIAQALETAERSEKRLTQVRQEIGAEVARAREQADEIIARARREAVAISEESAAKARSDAASFIDRARADVDVERERAITELRRELSQLVVQGAGAVLSEALDEKTQSRLIRESLEKVTPQRGAEN